MRKSTKNVDSLVKFVVRGGWREILLPLIDYYPQHGPCGAPAQPLMVHVSRNERRNGHDSDGRAEAGLKGPAQHRVDFGHRDQLSQILKAGDTAIGNAASANRIVPCDHLFTHFRFSVHFRQKLAKIISIDPFIQT